MADDDDLTLPEMMPTDAEVLGSKVTEMKAWLDRIEAEAIRTGSVGKDKLDRLDDLYSALSSWVEHHYPGHDEGHPDPRNSDTKGR